MIKSLFSSLILTLSAFSLSLSAGPIASSANTQVQLVSENSEIAAGESFELGVWIKMNPGWHTYWKNPGQSGFSTSIDWTLPEGFSAGEIQWPAPILYEVSGIYSYVYENQVLLKTTITTPANIKPAEIDIRAKVEWLECEKETCLPGSASLSIMIAVSDNAKQSTHAQLFKQVFATKPKALEAVTLSVGEGFENVILTLKGALPKHDHINFFSSVPSVLSVSTPPVVRKSEDTTILTFAKSKNFDGLPKQLSGLLILDEGKQRAYELTQTNSPSTEIAETILPANAAAGKSLATYLIFAFIGGLILNLMPCVFPVISLKVLSFVKQAEEDAAKAFKHGLVFAAGVLVSFWALAAIVISLQQAGETVGWGFQLQSPTVVLVMLVLFVLLALSMFGLFEIGTTLTTTGGNLSNKKGFSGSFFSGVLATVVATPCTAPFLAPAVGFAFAQSGAVIFLIFTAVGLGMASPYVILSSNKNLLEKMPRPGPWMETMKQAMGFLFLATAAWLIGVYNLQTGNSILTRLLLSLTFLALGAWIYGKYGALHHSKKSKTIAALIFITSIASVYFISGPQHKKAVDPSTSAHSTTGAWRHYTPDAVKEVLASGQAAFVDFTAAWCLSCQANKKTTLTRQKVMDAFEEKNVVTFEADWTDKNEMIAKALAAFGRSGVPLYVLYKDAESEPIILPQVLTPGIVIDQLEKL